MKKECKQCGKVIEHAVKSTKFCSHACHKEFDYDVYISRWKSGEINGMVGKYDISNHIRRYLFTKYKSSCSRCWWGSTNPTSKTIPLEIEHIDGNHRNNEESNLTLLCPNCHSLTPTYKSLNKGNGRKDRAKYSLYSAE